MRACIWWFFCGLGLPLQTVYICNLLGVYIRNHRRDYSRNHIGVYICNRLGGLGGFNRAVSGRGAFGAWGLGGFGGGVAVPGFARAGRGPPRFAPVSAPLIPAKAPQAPSPKNYPGTLTARAGRSPPRKRAFWARCPPKKAALIPRPLSARLKPPKPPRRLQM